MKSVSPSVRRARQARNARRLVLWLSLSLLGCGVPFITHGQLQAELETGRATASQQARAGRKPAEFVPGRALVRFRTEAVAKSAEARVASVELDNGTQAAAQIERF